MTLTNIRPGDIVRVDKKGRVFLATVVEKSPGRLRLDPIQPNITWHECTAREVIAHWVRRGAKVAR